MSLKLKCNSCDGIYSDSLDVRFTKACDNACPYCIEKDGLGSMVMDVDKMIRNTVVSGKKTVLILGGEPFLYPEKLLAYVRGIREYVESIYITTSVPEQILSDAAQDVIKLVDGVNVSTNHNDPDLNNEGFKAKNKHNRHLYLKELIRNHGSYKFRVSINLVRGQIDTMKKLDYYLWDMVNLYGVTHVKINELQNTPDLYVSFDKIWKHNMLGSPFSSGCQTTFKYWNKLRLTVKRSCFIVEPSKSATFMDLVKVLVRRMSFKKRKPCAVMYESGMLSDGWQ